MTEASPIPVPWPVKWSHFRSRWLPVFTLALCVAISAVLWKGERGPVRVPGVVESSHLEIASPHGGTLLPLPGGLQLQPLMPVKQGDLLAKLDDGPGTELRAPAGGTVTRIHRRPGESIVPGDPIVTLAPALPADAPVYILAYVRQDQRLNPVVGGTVEVRINGNSTIHAHVQSVGPQFEPVPSRQLADPRVAEWGQPIRLAVPAGAGLRPGELVQVLFK